MPAHTTFEHPFGVLELHRFPISRDYSLLAFSSADELLLMHIQEHAPEGPIWVMNDHFGALSLALSHREVIWIGDRRTAWYALEQNAAANNISQPRHHWLADLPDDVPPPGLVVMNVPKENDLLAYELHLLAQRIAPGTPVWATGMTRNIHMSTLALFETHIGVTKTSLARKKARLILSEKSDSSTGVSPSPQEYTEPLTTGKVISLPGVFSADRPDAGSALLAKALPALPEGARVVDAGCGNGYLMVVAAGKNKDIILSGYDDSSLACASAGLTLAANNLQGTIIHEHALNGAEPASADIVICNPPFHQDYVRHDAPAWDMFTGARNILRSGGEFWIVGNRNLGYHIPLTRLFKKVDVMASDPVYTVFRCIKS